MDSRPESSATSRNSEYDTIDRKGRMSAATSGTSQFTNVYDQPHLLDKEIKEKMDAEPTTYVNDDKYGFLARGRDYQPADVCHQYTEEEKNVLAAYESKNYLPSHSVLYKSWLTTQTERRFNTACWVVMGLIGVTVGVIGFFLHQIIALISDTKVHMLVHLYEEEKYTLAWIWGVGYTMIFVTISATSVAFFKPTAGGSGIPEVSGYLNGTDIHKIFGVNILIVKFLSCVCAIGAGMPVGPEGPMIHVGALVGAGIGQMRTGKLKLPFFHRLRNSEDQRNFVSAGVAAGIASAFGAPIGGLLYSMEEVTSFWTKTLSWQIFFCCMVATFVTELFNSALRGFKPLGPFGQFRSDRYILFNNKNTGIKINLLMFIPTTIIGTIGGILGALFTFLHLKIGKMRKKFLSKFSTPITAKCVRCSEPILFMVVVTSIYIGLPNLFGCTEYSCSIGGVGNISYGCYNITENGKLPHIIHYKCKKGNFTKLETIWYTNGTYNEVASFFFLTGKEAVENLFSRNTHLQLGYASLSIVFVLYFTFVCWASGTAVACGILVPILYIGGLYGRLVGLMLVHILVSYDCKDSNYWSWMDPGAFALIGSASFFGGVTRLTTAVTVIMIELTNDVQFLLPIMLSIMIAKWLGDFFTHPIDHSILELKCIPFLPTHPRLVICNKRFNAELFTAGDVMASPVATLYPRQSVYKVAKILLITTHSGFPIVKKKTMTSESKHFYGLITRAELCVLLMKEELFCTQEDFENEDTTDSKGLLHVTYSEIISEKPLRSGEAMERLQKYIEDTTYRNLYIDLYPFINDSAISIPTKFSLYRTYLIFRTMGLRHIVVVNEFNCVKGIITRKDLMDFKMLECVYGVLFRRTKDDGKKKESRKPTNLFQTSSWNINNMWDTSILDSELADIYDTSR